MANIMKNIIFYSVMYFCKIVYYVISMIFNIRKERIFVNCFDGMPFGDNPKYILKELIKYNSEFEVIWLNRFDTGLYVYNNCMSIKYVKPLSFKAIYYQATSGIWISTVRMPLYSIKRSKQLYIQTWHGSLNIKKIEGQCSSVLSPRYINIAKNDAALIDAYVAPNEDMSSIFLKYFWYKRGDILRVGSPRNVVFFQKNNGYVDELKERYGFVDKKVLLYAPTFRTDSSFRAYDVDFRKIIKELESKTRESWVVVVRLHPRLLSKANDYIRYDSKILNGNKIEDIQELMQVSDALITDYSSICFDFMNSKKPIFIYAKDIVDYRKDRDFHIEISDLPFPISSNNDELVGQIKNYNYEKYIENLIKFQRKYKVYDNADSANKVARYIYNWYKTVN